MLGHVALVRTDVSEEHCASIIRVARIHELGTTLAVTSNQHMLRRLLVTANVVPSSPILVTLMMEALRSSETSALTSVTWPNIPEDDSSRQKVWNCLFKSGLKNPAAKPKHKGEHEPGAGPPQKSNILITRWNITYSLVYTEE
jgi:hypothetical protein